MVGHSEDFHGGLEETTLHPPSKRLMVVKDLIEEVDFNSLHHFEVVTVLKGGQNVERVVLV